MRNENHSLKKRSLWIALTASLCVFLPAVRAEVWKYTTEDGKTQYTDSKTKIPEKYRDNAVQIKGSQNLPPVIPAPSAPPPAAAQPPGKRVGVDVDADGNGKEYWQGRLKELQDREKAIDARLAEIDGTGYLGTAPAARQLGAKLADEKAALEKEKAEIPARISALQEEARRKGAPPGWVR